MSMSKRRREQQEIQKKLFPQLCAQNGLPMPDSEYRFAPPRKWRMDYAFPQGMVAVECEGGVWTGGRHTRGSGFVKDMEKYNEAAVRGWRIVRCTPDDLCKIETLETIRRALEYSEAA